MKNPQALCYNKFRLRTGDFLCAKVRNMCWKTGGSYMEKKKKSMKLRTRVIISFFIIILVPIVMCALTFYFFVGYKAKIIGEKYGLANATYRSGYHPSCGALRILRDACLLMLLLLRLS